MSDKNHNKTHAGVISCEEIQQQLSAYMMRELGDKQSRLIREHIRGCESCRKQAAQLEKMQELLRSQNRQTENHAPVLSEKRMRRLRFAAMHPVFDWIYYRHRFVSIACAITLLVMILFLLRNFAIFREPDLEDSIPVWQMFRSERLQDYLERAAGRGAEEP